MGKGIVELPDANGPCVPNPKSAEVPMSRCRSYIARSIHDAYGASRCLVFRLCDREFSAVALGHGTVLGGYSAAHLPRN